jgi:hypothetical protein
MRALSTAELMTVWEFGMARSTAERALALLAVACTDDASSDQLAQLTVGECDQQLLTLRERTFGPQLAAVSSCPACGGALQFGINGADIGVPPASDPIETIVLEHAGYELRFRLPNSLDIMRLDPNAENQTNRQQLLRQCVLTARRAGANVSADELPPDVVAAISDRMAQADPQADVQLALACPRCEHRWNSPLDIASFFWSEINAWAMRLLNDVHVLASAYGWRETDILSMSSTRRQAYLELVCQ